MPSIICQRCHAINEPNSTTCQQCGARFCPYCHLLIESPNAAVCPHCGKKDTSFRPSRFGGPAAPVSSSGTSQSYCSNCGSKISPGTRTCPYCGRMGNVVTQSPVQGHGVMQPAQGDPAYAYAPAAEQVITTQKVCSKCRTPIPPGSSMCPIHGKFGGGSTLREGSELLPGRHTGDLWRRIDEKRTAAAASPTRIPSRLTPPEEVYPQMSAVPYAAPPEAMPQSADQRICANCNNPVPDRSKVCPTCGNNRLPAEKTRPYVKAEDRYRAAAAAQQPYAAAYAPPQQDQFYGQPAMQPMQPYEMAYPAPSPGFIEEIKPEKSRKPAKKAREYEDKTGRPRQQAKGSPLPILVALVALAGVIIMGVVFIMDQLKTPAPAVMLPSVTTPAVGSSQAPVITDVGYSDIGRTSATVTWKTDKKSNSIVIYCLDGGTVCENALDQAMVTDHVVKLTGLEQGKSYHITVKSRLGDSPDSLDASLEETRVLQLSDVRDTVPPVISDVAVSNISSSAMGGSAEITWKTDEPATSQVSYGTSAMYGTLQPSQTDTTMAKFHDVILYGLAPQMTFHYKVVSRDADGNERSSPDATFVTPAAAGSSIGDSAPDFTLACADGSQVTLSSLIGKKVIINFWNLQCHYCMEEMPYLQEVRGKYPESSVAMLVINSAAGGFPANRREAVGAQITTGGYTFNVPLDEMGSVAQAYNVTSGIPVTFFVDAKGIIKSKQDGSFPSTAAIEARLNSF